MKVFSLLVIIVIKNGLSNLIHFDLLDFYNQINGRVGRRAPSLTVIEFILDMYLKKLSILNAIVQCKVAQ